MATPCTRRSPALVAAPLVAGLLLVGCSTATDGADGVDPQATAAAVAAARPGPPRALALAVEEGAVVATWAAPQVAAGAITGYELFVDDAPAVVLDAGATSSRLAGVAPGDGVLVQLRAVAGDLPGRTAEASLDRVYRRAAPRWAVAEDRAAAAVAVTQVAASPVAAPAVLAGAPAAPAEPTSAPERAPVVTDDVPTRRPVPSAPDWAALYRDVEASVVQVSREGCAPGDGSTGTAFFVGPDLLATAAHVVEDAASLGVVVGGRYERAEVVGLDAREDVALLRLATAHPGLELPLAVQPPAVGTPMALVGFASGLGKSLQLGTVSSLLPTFSGLEGVALTDAVQSDAQTSPGASGGPWLLADGTVVALTSTGVDTNVTVGAGAPTTAGLLASWSRAPQPAASC